MITFTAAGLRALADALDGLGEIERKTGVLIEGHGGNTLTATSAATLEFSRRTADDAELVEYVIEIREG